MHFLAATLLFATALAARAPAPVNKAYLPSEPLPRVAPNTSTCALRYLTMAGLTSSTLVDHTPTAMAASHVVKKEIRKKIRALSGNPGFVCQDNGHGQTMLIWNTNLKSTKVNDGLRLAFPMIDFTCDSWQATHRRKTASDGKVVSMSSFFPCKSIALLSVLSSSNHVT